MSAPESGSGRTGARPALLGVAFAALLGLTGCGALPLPPGGAEPPPFEFRLGPGDRINVSVWGEERLSHDLELGPDGVVSFPLVGDVNLGGLTMDEARVDLAQRLKASHVDPVVSISLREMRSHVVHVVGEVARPGTVPFVRGATMLGAIMAAGGFLPASADLGAVRLIRARMGQPEAYVLDLEAVLAGEARDAWLVPGDTVYVTPRTLTRWSWWWRQAFPWSDPVEHGQGRRGDG